MIGVCLSLGKKLSKHRDEGSQADRAPAISPKFMQSPANKELQQNFLESKSLSRKWENRKERIANAVSRLLIITENRGEKEKCNNAAKIFPIHLIHH